MLKFTVHRPGTPDASPCSHGMPCRDVLGRIHVSVTGVSAGYTAELRLALSRFRGNVPARAATLGRIHGVDLLDPADGLVLQPPNQKSPARGKYFAIKARLGMHLPAWRFDGALGRANHIGDAQILDADHVESASQISGDFLTPVFAGVSVACPESGNIQFDASSTLRSALGSRHLPFEQKEAAAARRTQSGNAEELTCGQSSGNSNPPIYTHHRGCSRPRHAFGLQGERDVPTARTVKCYSIGLHTSRYRPGQKKTHPANFGYPHVPGPSVQATHMLRLNVYDPETFAAPGFTPRWPTIAPSEEPGHCLCEVSQCLLLHDDAPGRQPVASGPCFRELATLLRPTRGRLASWSPPQPLLGRKVPHEPSMSAVLSKHRLLDGRRQQAVSRHESNITATTDIPRGVQRCNLSALSAEIPTPCNR